jgi:peptidoglycan biosynthesis protein MviN/MurJ (putative lipid II flippase)
MVKLPANTAFIRSCSVLVVFLVLNKLLGFVEKILIANYFGTSTDADVFIVAQGLFVSGWLFVEEILSPALIPVLSQARRDGRDRAGQVLVQRVLLLLVPAVVAFAVCSTAF